MDTLYTKLGAVAAAVAMNAAVMTAVLYLFAIQGHPHLVGLA